MRESDPGESFGSIDWAVLAAQLRRFALALTRSRDEADDLMQQTFANLLAKTPERAGHGGYARRTMTRLWLDRQRSLRRRMIRLARFAAGARVWHADPDRASAAEQVALVREAIQRLPPLQRATLALRLIEGLSYAEIAETLGCSVEAVRANLHLARQRMRRVLEEKT